MYCAVIHGGFPPARVSDADFIIGPIQVSALKKSFFPKKQQSNKEQERTPVWWCSATCIKAWLLWTFAGMLSHCFKQSPRISIERWQICNGRPLLKLTDVPRLHFLHRVWPLKIKIPWTFWYTWTWKLALQIDYRPSEILFTSDWHLFLPFSEIFNTFRTQKSSLFLWKQVFVFPYRELL